MSTSQEATEMIDYPSEQWRTIDDFYEVSNFGHVAALGGRLLHRRMNDFGYFVVRLCSRRIEEVHRLVALAFVPNPTALPAAIHVNGNPTDNRPINLKWCSFESYVFARSLRSKRRLPKLTAYGRSGGNGYDGADRSSSIDFELSLESLHRSQENTSSAAGIAATYGLTRFSLR